MRLLIGAKPQLGCNLQVEVVVDVTSRDDMRVNVLLATCHYSAAQVVVHFMNVFVSNLVINLSQIEKILL